METPNQLSPPAMNGSGSRRATFREALRAQEQALVEELEEAEIALAKYKESVEQLRQYLAALGPIFRAEGMEPRFKITASPTESRIGTPGNKSSNMPPRREQFRTMKLPDAVDQLLADGEPWHADELVKAIYEVESYKQHRAAKATLASALSAGDKSGRWERVQPNTFQRKAEVMAADE